eukprot:TRINITY_DN88_c0_g1_i1.p1 TRINITY_DN88_c0_g1~~TRINITY_DN88_c0_g1_i1.p1  ORF type:complete len:239 (-),score=59.32 TRINITY_DN88_c0_g1_i1:196-912(-)
MCIRDRYQRRVHGDTKNKIKYQKKVAMLKFVVVVLALVPMLQALNKPISLSLSMMNNMCDTKFDYEDGGIMMWVNPSLGIAKVTDSCLKTVAFLAQLLTHSCELRCFETRDDGSAYEGHAELGNTQPGDGKKYRPRGGFHIVGKNAYTKYGKILGTDFVKDPTVIGSGFWGIRLAAAIWDERGVNKFADTKDPATFEKTIIQEFLSTNPNVRASQIATIKNKWCRGRRYLCDEDIKCD